MTDKNLRSQLQVGELGERASSAASALLGKATLATAPDLRHIAVARRLSVVAALAGFALVVGSIFALVAVRKWRPALDRGHRPGHGGRWRDRFGPACRGPRLVRAVAGHRPGRDLGLGGFGRALDVPSRLGTRCARLRKRLCWRSAHRPGGRLPACLGTVAKLHVAARCRWHHPRPALPGRTGKG